MGMRTLLLLTSTLLVALSSGSDSNSSSGSPNCDTFKDCAKCTSSSSWWPDSKCNWCPLDLSCHAHVSLESPCAKSQNVHDTSKCAISNPPEQIHIALASNTVQSTGMNVMWFTLGAVPGSVRYGDARNKLSNNVSAETPKKYLDNSGFHHSATLAGLQHDTTYYYQAGSEDSGWGTVNSFKTAPSDASKKVVMSIYGDLGFEGSNTRPLRLPAVDGLKSNWSAAVTRERLEMLKDSIDLVWHLGDIGYADDGFASSPLAFSYEDIYNQWMNWMQNISATKPYMVTPGNHETECHSPTCLASAKGKTLSNFSAFNTRWQMPFEQSGSTSNMWYSYDFGPVHIVSIDSETDFDGNHGAKDRLYDAGGFGVSGEQEAWIRADLAAAHEGRVSGKTGIKWILVGGHRPIGDLAQFHKDVFKEYGVDMYFAGHSHSYSRSSDVNGTMLVVVGGAGCDEMAQEPKTGFSAQEMSTLDDTRQGAWWQPGYNVPLGTEEFSSARYATGVLTADQTSLQWQLIDSEDGEVLDHQELKSKY